MACTEFELKDVKGVTSYLESRKGEDVVWNGAWYINGGLGINAGSEMNAAKQACKRCPVVSTCRPRYSYNSSLGQKTGIYVGGIEITSGQCILRIQGLSPEDLRPHSGYHRLG